MLFIQEWERCLCCQWRKNWCCVGCIQMCKCASVQMCMHTHHLSWTGAPCSPRVPDAEWCNRLSSNMQGCIYFYAFCSAESSFHFCCILFSVLLDSIVSCATGCTLHLQRHSGLLQVPVLFASHTCACTDVSLCLYCLSH